MCRSKMEVVEGQFLIEEWTSAFLGGRIPLGSCNTQDPSAKRQKKVARGKDYQKQTTEKTATTCGEERMKKEKWYSY